MIGLENGVTIIDAVSCFISQVIFEIKYTKYT